jgi:hypothetical protein
VTRAARPSLKKRVLRYKLDAAIRSALALNVTFYPLNQSPSPLSSRPRPRAALPFLSSACSTDTTWSVPCEPSFWWSFIADCVAHCDETRAT